MQKTKILLLGATGMAGHVVYQHLIERGEYDITNLVYRSPLNKESIVVDVNDKEKLKSIIVDQQPDYIINCIGILIKGSKDHPDNAIYINAFLPHFLANIADEIKAKLIHISTDCVFSGKKGSYGESDFRDADDVYGRSKALGEIVSDNHLTIRTSIIGPEIKVNGEGLFHWFLNQAGEINGFTQAIWGGITTLELAKVIDEAIKQGINGLINITNGQGICKYDLLKLFQNVYSKTEIRINEIEGKAVDKSLISQRTDFDYIVPSYEQMIKEQFQWMDRNRNLYEKFYRF